MPLAVCADGATGRETVFNTGPRQVPEKPEKTVKAQNSTIAEGLTLTGEISGQGDVLLDGTFNGTIQCNRLTVGRTGYLEGRVKAKVIVIHGKVQGEIEAENVTLSKSAQVTGNVYHQVLEVAAGAKVEGRYSRQKPGKANFETKVLPSQKEQPPRAPKASNKATAKQDAQPCTPTAPGNSLPAG